MASPQVFSDAASMRAFNREQRRQGKTIGFVPTMGYLHEGHVSLVQAAREQCDVVIASIYVNPTQFSKNEDFGVYPRSQEEDLRKLQQAGCAAVFMPPSLYHQGSSSTSGGSSGAGPTDGGMVVGASEAYDPLAHETWVNVEHLSQGLCARSRPHFFRGVCTVVTKLFNIVDPDKAFFGKKDYQQWRVLQRMARDLDFGIEVVGMPIVREPDGLAMSSRNAMLPPEHRQRATCIAAALAAARDAAQQGMCTAAADIQRRVSEAVEGGGGRLDYVEIVNSETLQLVDDTRQQPTLVVVAAHFGKVRLIDNIEI